MVHKSEHTMPTTNGEGEHGAATARRKLKPGGGSQPLSMEQPNDADPQC